MIASTELVSGLSGRQPPQNGKQQRKSRGELVEFIPACSDFCYAHQIYLAG
ncbi:TPA: hypothetical protein MAG25_005532 [Klebsiella quasipneumoniae subsp. quasipneumoniae]|jgi:hypothetical protein|nr:MULTISPECIES: hypothetical protein [Klebsiella/Raoultella group]ELN8757325.1 hypothetical protein [Klebsiella variicola]KDV97354.1 hypothetical protein AB00_5535 [Raoultella ornithinolytica 2-156-04_S1_C1]KDX07699.1 hypothetical protein AB28_5603 [Raoultella ornithinolytica 2-156-04_S1_C2]BAS41081.1 unnamed protein product [Klebsiella oxytoca]HBS3705519.1 hypothetical protein [Klebsiella quasipneumoniae subsp. quasipneumoniae]